VTGSSRANALATVSVTLAAVLVWQSVVMLTDRDAAVAKFRLAEWLQPSTARTTVVVIAVVGCLAGGLLVAPRTRCAGATVAAAGLLVLAGYLVVAWALGEPVQCLCSTSSPARDSFAHAVSIVVVLACGVLCGFVAVAGRPRRRARAGR
jgi:hypothetical protein